MNISETQEPTPDQVQDLATRQAKLPKLALIGTFGAPDTRGALIRKSSGAVTRVTVGDRVSGRTVAAIGEDNVVLSRNGASKVLRLPKS